MADSLDKIVYSFVMEDVLKGLFIHVPPGYVACVYDLGQGVLKKVLTPGLHLKIPFWQKAKLFNIQTLEYSIAADFNPDNIKGLGDTPIKSVTSDNKIINIEGTVLLRLDMEYIPMIWQWVGEDFVAKIVRPTVRSRLRMISSRYTHSEILSGKRDEVEVDIKHELERIFSPRGIKVENILLSEVSLAEKKEIQYKNNDVENFYESRK
ncbi:prohibitin family protein [Candidatus Parcubacteria bacterium]|nr:prohibitin family protein [Patescibacteria group bacterium]MCG2693748.1 prohibitin family protein [Candidatus Parcubacteria bacterium]